MYTVEFAAGAKQQTIVVSCPSLEIQIHKLKFIYILNYMKL